jgi:hypothetical protein
MRQEVQLLNENLINDLFILFFNFFMPMYPTNKSSSVTENMKTYTLRPHVIPHKSRANVRVLEQIKHVNSQLSKVSNKTQEFYHQIMCSKFKLTDETKSQFFQVNQNFKTT